MIQKYRVKKLFDNNVLVGFSKPRRITGNPKMLENEEVMYSDVIAKHLKVDKINGNWKIVEDLSAKTIEEDKKAQKEAARTLFENLKISDLDTVAKIKPVVLQLTKLLKDLL